MSLFQRMRRLRKLTHGGGTSAQPDTPVIEPDKEKILGILNWVKSEQGRQWVEGGAELRISMDGFIKDIEKTKQEDLIDVLSRPNASRTLNSILIGTKGVVSTHLEHLKQVCEQPAIKDHGAWESFERMRREDLKFGSRLKEDLGKLGRRVSRTLSRNPKCAM